MTVQYQVDPVHLEKAIMTVIMGVSRDDWAEFTMGSLRVRLTEFDVALVKASDGEIVDCICSLEKSSLIATRKAISTYPFTRAQAEEDRYRHQFFWIGSFELKVTHEGRKVLGHIEVKVADSIASPPDEMDDRLPLYRPRVFDADLERVTRESLNRALPLALVIVDVDNFKKFNDLHDYLTGNAVLLSTASVIAQSAEGKGKAYRYGGDEMAILLVNYTKAEAIALAERIRLEIEQSEVTEKKLKVTATFGVAALPEDAQGGKELFKRANEALQSAKQLGRNLVRAVGDTDEVKQSSTPIEVQPTLLSLMDTGFPDLNKLWGSPVIGLADGTTLKIRSALYFDLFTSGAKFLGFYVPSSARTLEACSILASHAVELGNSVANSGLSITGRRPGENSQTVNDLRYSGKVYLYHEDALTHRQMADVEEFFRLHQLTVVLRGPDFLTQAWVAWKKRTL